LMPVGVEGLASRMRHESRGNVSEEAGDDAHGPWRVRYGDAGPAQMDDLSTGAAEQRKFRHRERPRRSDRRPIMHEVGCVNVLGLWLVFVREFVKVPGVDGERFDA